MNLLAILKSKHERQQNFKDRLLKNREAVLDAFSSNIDGAKCCPLLIGQKCIGKMCELFIELESVSSDGSKVKFWRCSLIEQNILLIELNQNILKLIKSLEEKK